ncbi:MAG: hypothetical protein OXC92_05885 [Flavobacteriaceae bacterium]|nr:hypothetical protein [Flavobacteriaceae bacterium]MCY4254198.1 hypothetical protein [Flavobacteriaceae bacterium]
MGLVSGGQEEIDGHVSNNHVNRWEPSAQGIWIVLTLAEDGMRGTRQ